MHFPRLQEFSTRVEMEASRGSHFSVLTLLVRLYSTHSRVRRMDSGKSPITVITNHYVILMFVDNDELLNSTFINVRKLQMCAVNHPKSSLPMGHTLFLLM